MLFSVDRYVATLRFTATRHLGQVVTDSQLPYIVHVTSVAAEVIAAIAVEPVDDPDLAIGCALLHDTIEDTATTYAEVAAAFGIAVADGASAVQGSGARQGRRDGRQPAPHRAPAARVRMVKLADRITNLAPPPAKWTTDRRRSYRDEAIAIHAALGDASPLLAERLLGRIDAYQAHF
jgi:(p)ppGpp synthase/HD superfamily hydrolase